MVHDLLERREERYIQLSPITEVYTVVLQFLQVSRP